MQNRLIRPRALDEARVGNLVDALEALVSKSSPGALVGTEVPSTETLSFYHSRLLPKPALRTLVRAVVKARIAFDWTTAAMAVSLVLRYRRLHTLTPHMMHRMMIGAMLIAAKAHQDVIPTNKLVSKTVGISITELARIERLFCAELDYRVNVNSNDLVLDEVELCGKTINVDAASNLSESILGSRLVSPTSIVGQSLPATPCAGGPTSSFDRSQDFVTAA
jgi:hypothetical protein